MQNQSVVASRIIYIIYYNYVDMHAIIIYTFHTYRGLYIMVLYRYIVRYGDIMVLCYGILWFMELYGHTELLYYAILSYYASIHSSDFLQPFLYGGKYNLL